MGYGVPVAPIVSSGEFVHIAPHVFLGEVVEGTDVSALQQRPKGLDPVGVRHVADILADRMLDGFVRIFAHALVGFVAVCVDRGTGLHLGTHRAFQVNGVRPLYGTGLDATGLAFAHSNDRLLADSAAPGA